MGRWLVEIIDEDPAQRWISPSGQFHEKISDIVVFSGDVMQLDPLEFVLELTHLLVVRCHEGALAGGFLHDLINDQLRVAANVESRSVELDSDAQSVDEGFLVRGIV